jgi:Cu(I)/Ag(I) efflux system membrane fusion protein
MADRLQAKKGEAGKKMKPGMKMPGGGGASTAGEEAHDHGRAAPAGEHGDVYYTCSMHPTVVQDEPGTCPICGMDLVKKKK